MVSSLVRSHRRACVGPYDLLGVEYDPLATQGISHLHSFLVHNGTRSCLRMMLSESSISDF